MGQVPQKILLVGDGRLAKTLAVLFPEALRWSRRDQARTSGPSLSSFISKSDPSHIWLAITDRALPELISNHSQDFSNRTVVHFAGSRAKIENVFSAHPLSTFSGVPQSAAEFEKIPFILDLDGPELSELIPRAKNPSYRIAPELRPYYHALCAMSGNFTVMLWEQIGARFESELGLPAQVLAIYREQIFKNLAQATGSVLTGPIARRDTATMTAHHDALAERGETSLLEIYDGFANLHAHSQTKDSP